jgi:microcystin-dependent protein
VKYRHAAGSIPIGCIIPHISSNPPSAGFLKCDGSSYSKLEYKALFNVIGYIYGGVDTSFNVPNMMNRKPYMSSSKKLNQTNNATVSNETNMRALDINNLPKHGHNISNMGITHSHIGSGTLQYKHANSFNTRCGYSKSGKTPYVYSVQNIERTSSQNNTNNIKMNISNDTSGTPIDVENNWCNLYYYIRCI